jgi:predicted nuclease of predicted toxin-antitoxin system
MKFLCDVHISFKLVKYLEKKGFECIHVNNILDKWFTKDSDISKFADLNDYIIITKDQDFKNSHLLKNSPKKLIRIILGNISNFELLELFEKYLPAIEFQSQTKSFFIEIGTSLVLYSKRN